MKLPVPFLNEIQALLGDETDAFLKSYEADRHLGLRVNRLKIEVEDFLKISPFKLKPIPWTTDGFYYEEEDRPAKHPFYHAGLYYLQEPSAMAPVGVLDPQPGEVVLDLCACPGGKTLQIAAALGGKGAIVANDISTGRIKALVRNLEMAGATNVLVINETEEKLGARFENVFDRALIDAPCSGEGMFRKDRKAVETWSGDAPVQFRAVQDRLLDETAKMLKPGGRLVYSTCTFNRLENEMALEAFLARHERFSRKQPGPALGLDFRTGYGRLWPHLHEGEGHFIGCLEKHADGHENRPPRSQKSPASEVSNLPEAYKNFEDENLTIALGGQFYLNESKLYRLPEGLPSTQGLRVSRSGWYLGEVKNGRFIPSGAFAMGLKATDAKRVIRFKADTIEVIRYLKGETLSVEGEDGLNLICVEDYPLGWGKLSKGVLKNQYPAAWRML